MASNQYNGQYNEYNVPYRATLPNATTTTVPSHTNDASATTTTQATPAEGAGDASGGAQGTQGNNPTFNYGLYQVPGYEQLQQQYQSYLNSLQGQTAANSQGSTLGPLAQAQGAQVGPLSQAQNSAFRENQAGVLSYLNSQMQGQNSIAAIQGQQQQDALMRQQMAMAASARPGQTGMAQRISAQNQANIGAQMGASTLAAQLAERNAAAQNLGVLASQAREQDQGLSMFNASQGNQYNLANAQLGQQNQQFNASQGNQYNLAGAQLGQQNQQFNAQQANAFTGMQNQYGLGALSGMTNLAGMQQSGGAAYGNALNAQTLATMSGNNALAQIAAQKPELWQQLVSMGATSLPAILQLFNQGNPIAQQAVAAMGGMGGSAEAAGMGAINGVMGYDPGSAGYVAPGMNGAIGGAALGGSVGALGGSPGTAAAGAMTGAALGAVAGPVGAVVGGGISAAAPYIGDAMNSFFGDTLGIGGETGTAFRVGPALDRYRQTHPNWNGDVNTLPGMETGTMDVDGILSGRYDSVPVGTSIRDHRG